MLARPPFGASMAPRPMGTLRVLRRAARGLRRLAGHLQSRRTIRLYELLADQRVDVPARLDYAFKRVPDLTLGPHIELMKKLRFYDPSDLARAQELGDRCFTATIDGRIRGFIRVSSRERRITEIDYIESVDPSTAWIYAGAIDPEVRGHAIFQSMLSKVAADAFESGCTRVWVDVDERNRASIGGIEKAGFREIARLIQKIRWGKKSLERIDV